MTTDQIMAMSPGPELDKKIASTMTHISGDQHYTRPFSSDSLTALELWQFASDAFGSVALVKSSDGPVTIGEYCSIRDDEDEASVVGVMTSSWMESLAKAVLLFAHGHYGEHAYLAFQRMVIEAPVRNPH